MTGVVDLFAGPGGWEEGARGLDLDIVGVEWEGDACATARAAGHQRTHGDVRHWFPALQFGRPPFTGLLASPPCQTFSTAGKGSGRRALKRLLKAVPMVAAGASPTVAMAYRPATTWHADGLLFDMDGVDYRDALVLEPLRVIRDMRPRWVALEQVPSVLPVWDAIGDALTSWGYGVATGVLRAEQFGTPQTRRRAILIASLDRTVRMPVPTHSRYHHDHPERLDEGVAPWVSMADALGWGMTDRPYVSVTVGGAAGGTDPQVLGGTGARRTVQRELDAGRWRVNDQSGTERDPWWPFTRPATTIAGRDIVADPGANANRFNGSSKSRNDGVRVTLAEAGVLQSFPPDYPWCGTLTRQFQQVGDAIPPTLAHAILEAVR